MIHLWIHNDKNINIGNIGMTTGMMYIYPLITYRWVVCCQFDLIGDVADKHMLYLGKPKQ